MTWSILARDPEDGALGIAVASRFFAVGALIPHGHGGVGAVATQAYVNPLYGAAGLAALAAGQFPEAVIAELVTPDDGRDSRQVHVMDANGIAAAHSGADCPGWAGHFRESDISLAGNTLAGPEVLKACRAAYEQTADRPLAERLLEAMEAGEAAGGDRRGRQSAALKIYTSECWPLLDIRADDHADPLGELRRLYDVAARRYLKIAPLFATAANPSGACRAHIDRKVVEIEDSGP